MKGEAAVGGPRHTLQHKENTAPSPGKDPPLAANGKDLPFPSAAVSRLNFDEETAAVRNTGREGGEWMFLIGYQYGEGGEWMLLIGYQ